MAGDRYHRKVHKFVISDPHDWEEAKRFLEIHPSAEWQYIQGNEAYFPVIFIEVKYKDALE